MLRRKRNFSIYTSNVREIDMIFIWHCENYVETEKPLKILATDPKRHSAFPRKCCKTCFNWVIWKTCKVELWQISSCNWPRPAGDLWTTYPLQNVSVKNAGFCCTYRITSNKQQQQTKEKDFSFDDGKRFSQIYWRNEFLRSSFLHILIMPFHLNIP